MVAVDARAVSDCDKWLYVFVRRDVNGVDGPGLRVDNACQVKFDDCQGADFLPGNVKTKPITSMRTCGAWTRWVVKSRFFRTPGLETLRLSIL